MGWLMRRIIFSSIDRSGSVVNSQCLDSFRSISNSARFIDRTRSKTSTISIESKSIDATDFLAQIFCISQFRKIFGQLHTLHNVEMDVSAEQMLCVCIITVSRHFIWLFCHCRSPARMKKKKLPTASIVGVNRSHSVFHLPAEKSVRSVVCALALHVYAQ